MGRWNVDSVLVTVKPIRAGDSYHRVQYDLNGVGAQWLFRATPNPACVFGRYSYLSSCCGRTYGNTFYRSRRACGRCGAAWADERVRPSWIPPYDKANFRTEIVSFAQTQEQLSACVEVENSSLTNPLVTAISVSKLSEVMVEVAQALGESGLGFVNSNKADRRREVTRIQSFMGSLA